MANATAHFHSHNDRVKSRHLGWAVLVTLGILAMELFGAWLSGSLALLSDAAHVLADLLSLLMSWIALHMSFRRPTPTRTFGLHRLEILAALANGLLLIGMALWIGKEAWQRFWAPPEIQTNIMLVIAVLGFIGNGLVARRLASHLHDLNVRSAYWHVLGDMLASLGVLAAAIIMALTHWRQADAVLSAAIGGLILFGGGRVLLDSGHLLLLGVPRHLKMPEIVAAMRQIPDVLDVHNVRLWAPCSNVIVLSAHVIVSAQTEEQRCRVRQALREMLAAHFGITETTFELEEGACGVSAELIAPLPHSSSSSPWTQQQQH